VPIVFLWKNVVDDIPVRQTWALKTMQFWCQMVCIGYWAKYQRDLDFQANKNLAINSIVGAAFGGKLNSVR
jgi:hypothetical protein